MKKKSTATHAAMNNNRIHVDLEVELLVLQCERSWAYFMQLKGKREDRIAKSADQDELEGARIKHHAIKRLRRGIQHATLLVSRCKELSQILATESLAYLATLQALFAFERGCWQEALDAFLRARQAYALLLAALPSQQEEDGMGSQILDYTLLARWQKQIDDLDPSVRYCGYILGQETDLVSLLSHLSTSTTGASSALSSKLSKQLSASASTLPLFQGLVADDQVIQIVIDNAAHVSPLLLLERCRKDFEKSVEDAPFPYLPSSPFSLSPTITNATSLNKKKSQQPSAQQIHQESLLDKWSSAALDALAHFSKTHSQIKSASETLSSSKTQQSLLTSLLLLAHAQTSHLSATLHRTLKLLSSTTTLPSSQSLKSRVEAVSLCEKSSRSLEQQVAALVSSFQSLDSSQQSPDDPPHSSSFLNFVCSSLCHNLTHQAHQFTILAQIYRSLIWWENSNPSLAFSIAHSLHSPSCPSPGSPTRDTTVLFPCTRELEKHVGVLKTSLYAFFVSGSIYNPSSSSSSSGDQQVGMGVGMSMELQSIPFRPLFYDLCVPGTEGLAENLAMLSKGQTRVSRIYLDSVNDDDDMQVESKSVEDKKSASGSGVLGWFGL